MKCSQCGDGIESASGGYIHSATRQRRSEVNGDHDATAFSHILYPGAGQGRPHYFGGPNMPDEQYIPRRPGQAEPAVPWFLAERIAAVEAEIRTEQGGSLRDRVARLVDSPVESVDGGNKGADSCCEFVDSASESDVACLQHGIRLIERGLKVITDSAHALSIRGGL